LEKKFFCLWKDFKVPLPSTKVKLIDDKLQRLINEGTISSVRLWNKENNLIYSTKYETKNTYVDSDNLKKALQNNQDYIIFDDKSITDTVAITEFIKFYLPIAYNGEIIGTYEVTKSYIEIRYHVKELTIIISSSIFLG
jgi:sulfur relay (sulfurtransferase) DsrF/TusC family protein